MEKDWNLYLNDILNYTKQYWDIHSQYTLFHHLISLIISQKIRFETGRKIRQNLYRYLNLEFGSSITAPQIRQLTDLDFQRICISNDKVRIIRTILTQIPDFEWNKTITKGFDTITEIDATFNSLQKISGIGPWTISSLKIMLYSSIYSNILLTSDKWIAARISELRPELKNVVNQSNYAVNLSEVSKFLWRIKPDGIRKFNAGIMLGREDFL